MTSEFEKLKKSNTDNAPLKKLDLILQKEIGNFLGEAKSAEAIQEFLTLWIETTARVVYTCVKDESRKNPAVTAKDFGHIIELAILGVAAKVNSITSRMKGN